LIKNNGFRLSAETYNLLHADSLAFIQSELQEIQHGKLAIFTHHCPTFLYYPEQYKGDVLNEAFAVELFDLIESSRIDFWVYGHHHRNIPEFTIADTKLVTNQLGYLQRNEHEFFDQGKFLEL
jgi:hypothetical protein